MTIRELYEEYREFEINETRSAIYNIQFVNSDGELDETQFTLDSESSESALEELIQLFGDFCKENGFREDEVVEVAYVCMEADDATIIAKRCNRGNF